MKLGRPFARCEAVLCEQVRIVKVDGLVEATARRIDVDHFEILTNRPGRQFLPRHTERHLANWRGIELRRQGRVQAVPAQPAECRTARGEWHWRRSREPFASGLSGLHRCRARRSVSRCGSSRRCRTSLMFLLGLT